VQVLKDRGDLCAIKLSLFDVEVTNASVVSEKITTGEEFSCKIDVAIVLEEAIVG